MGDTYCSYSDNSCRCNKLKNKHLCKGATEPKLSKTDLLPHISRGSTEPQAPHFLSALYFGLLVPDVLWKKKGNPH